MIRARNYLFPLTVFLAATGIVIFLSSGVFTSQLPSNWEAKYTNLKDDLRALALDPLDPRVIYLGSDTELLASTDGGANWTSLKSFRDDKILLSDVVSDQALRSILLIEETGGQAVRSRERRGGRERERRQPEQVREGEAPAAGPAGAAATEAESRYQGLLAQLEQAEEALSQAQANLAQAQTASQAWVPDSVTISEVDGIPVGDGGWVDEPQYSQLADWLSERGLSVPDGGGERQKALLEYLKDYALKGDALKTQLQSAQAPVAAAEARVKTLQDQVASARVQSQQAAPARVAAPEAPAAPEAEAPRREDREMRGPAPAATPLERDLERFISGVSYIAVDPSNPERIYVATFDGIFKTEDKGQSWKLAYRGGNTSQSCALYLAIDPSNPDTVYGGTLNGIARSADGGETWERPGGRINDKVITALTVHPFDSQTVFAGTQDNGVFKSSDGGITWEQVFTSATGNSVHAIQCAPSRPETVYAGTESGVITSFDGGQSWEGVSGMGLGTVEVRDLVIAPTSEDCVFIATRNGVFGTADGGKQWQRLTYGLSFRGSNFLSFDPLDPSSVWLITDNRLFHSAALPVLEIAPEEKTVLTGNCQFSFDGETLHSLIIEDVDEEAGIVKIEIQSDPQKLELKVGEPRNIDLDGDGEEDGVITAEGIVEGVPRITIYQVKKITAHRVEELKPPEEITGLEDLEPYFKIEPTWVEVQEAAARWAEVHPDKIAAWRSAASFRALLPRVRFEYTVGKGWSDSAEERSSEARDFDSYSASQRMDERSSSRGEEPKEGFYLSTSPGWPDTYEWFDASSQYDDRGWADGYFTQEGEETRLEERGRVQDGYREYRDRHLQLEWYLADFLFSREQLYISREARELVELRQDVLEQVTLYYFDRRSARIDMILNPPADSYSKLEMLLRLQQLDASLDALTGGYFSQTIKTRAKQYPSLPAY